jgi:hypothetical protein
MGLGSVRVHVSSEFCVIVIDWSTTTTARARPELDLLGGQCVTTRTLKLDEAWNRKS